MNIQTEASLASLTPLLEKENIQDIQTFLSQLHWEKIVENHDTTLYLSPCEEYVLRLCNNAIDDAHTYHTCNAITHSDNAYMPTIYWHVFIMPRKEAISLTVMEYLHVYDIHKEEYELLKTAFPPYAEEIEISDKTYEDFPELAEALDILRAPLHRFNLSSDIRTDNVMLRADGHLVITDPYAL